jgi:hypothetical protein
MRAKATGAVSLTLTSDAELMQEYLQTQGILVSTQNDGINQVAAFQNAEGQSEAIVIDPDGHLFHVCREPLSDSGWNMYGIGSGFQTIAAVDSATIWATGNDGALWRSDHGRWTQTQTLPSGNPAVAVSAGTDGTVWAADENTVYVKGRSTSQKPPVANPAIAPSLFLDSSNLLNFFCVDTSGSVWWIRQSNPGTGWGAWKSLGNPATNGGTAFTATIERIQVGPNQDGRLQVFAIGSDASVYTIWQQNVGGNWSKWWALGANTPAVASLAASQNQDGRLEIFVLLQDGSAVSHIWQTSPNSGWSDWTSIGLPAAAVSDLTAVLGLDGVQTVVVVSDLQYQTAHSISQTAPNQGWTGWPLPAAAHAQSGRTSGGVCARL